MSTNIVKNIGLYALLITGASFCPVAYSCAESCQDVQALRDDAISEFFQFSLQQKEFLVCAGMLVGNVRERRQEDVDTIIMELQQEGLREWPKQRQMELLQSLVGADSFYSYFEALYQGGGNKFYYSKFVFMGPATEVYMALTGGRENADGVGNRTVYPVYHQAGLDVLAEEENPIDFLAVKLVSKERRIGFYPSPENFTPGIAKIILFEALRQKARHEGQMLAFNQFAKRLKLGFQLPRSETKGAGANADFQHTAHDGYFLGATLYSMAVHSLESQVSFDCSSFVQYCAFGLDSFQRFKAITYDFVEVGRQRPAKDPRQQKAMAAINERFHVEELQCEDQLMPGDMIVFKGHMMIFKGYQREEGGGIAMKTIEAVGGENRSLSEFTRRIYNSDCNRFIWKRDQVFSGEEVSAYVVRFKG